MQKQNNNGSDLLTAYRLDEIAKKTRKPAARHQGNFSMPTGFFLDSFLKGCGVLFGFVQTPGYSGRK